MNRAVYDSTFKGIIESHHVLTFETNTNLLKVFESDLSPLELMLYVCQNSRPSIHRLNMYRLKQEFESVWFLQKCTSRRVFACGEMLDLCHF